MRVPTALGFATLAMLVTSASLALAATPSQGGGVATPRTRGVRYYYAESEATRRPQVASAIRERSSNATTAAAAARTNGAAEAPRIVKRILDPPTPAPSQRRSDAVVGVATHSTVAADTARRHHHKVPKRLKKYMLPLLLAYKLKFFTLIPLMMGGLILLAGSTGLAGFFFAMFAATMGLKINSGHR